MAGVRDDELGALERQLERGSLFAHTALSVQAERADETDAIVNGLVDLLVRDGVITADDLLAAVQAARAEAGEAATAGVALRVDAEAPPRVAVDCERRLPVCKAACCRLHFALTAEEVEAGVLKWDLGRPYLNRHGSDGYCQQLDRGTHGCRVYADRPSVCRSYSCAEDARIWKDFEAMELNQEWIDENLGPDGPVLVQMLPGA